MIGNYTKRRLVMLRNHKRFPFLYAYKEMYLRVEYYKTTKKFWQWTNQDDWIENQRRSYNLEILKRKLEQGDFDNIPCSEFIKSDR